ncbi:hypothetical protein [Mesorhizobium sp. NZP2077]|uniref:hypothetical protein n=1 Tax=Mesorhizobium sp. NZP2077 TaxID=2483404 RepID=UPI001557601B|nr:hypothetical protein [Mesorhizobium sp. NZP2077]QKD14922.1 hypothetical protein HGP13_07190 [Mesorhizobium sp. NZP2077]
MLAPVPECCFRAISQSVRAEEQDASLELKTLAARRLIGRRLVRDSLAGVDPDSLASAK